MVAEDQLEHIILLLSTMFDGETSVGKTYEWQNIQQFRILIYLERLSYKTTIDSFWRLVCFVIVQRCPISNTEAWFIVEENGLKIE